MIEVETPDKTLFYNEVMQNRFHYDKWRNRGVSVGMLIGVRQSIQTKSNKLDGD